METEMSAQIPAKRFKKALFRCLDETSSNVHGIYLDKGTTLFETLEGVSAEEASRAISSNSATIAAQVEHVRFYLDVLDEYLRSGEEKTNNWREIWETVREVTPEQWEDLKRRLIESHKRAMARSIHSRRGRVVTISPAGCRYSFIVLITSAAFARHSEQSGQGTKRFYGRSNLCPRGNDLELPSNEAPGRTGGCDPGALQSR